MGTISKVITLSGVAGIIYLATKAYQNNEALRGLTSKIVNVKDVKLGFDKITLKLDILLSNTSTENLGISGDLLSIKQVQFFSRVDSKLIAIADVNVTGIEIPGKTNYNLNDVLVTIDQPLQNITSLVSLFSGNIKDKLKIGLIFTSLGKSYSVDSDTFV